MNKFPSLLLSALVPLGSAFAESPLEAATGPEMWEITVIRAARGGQVLRSASSPLMLFRARDFIGTLSIDMGGESAPEIWAVDYEGTLGGVIRFEVSDTGRIHSWNSEGTSHHMPVELFDVTMPCEGPGRYPVFSLDGETVSVEIGPPGQRAARPERIEPPLEVVLTMRDLRGQIVSDVTAPWHEIDGEGSVSLAIRPGKQAGAAFRLVDIKSGLPDKEVRFRLKDPVRTPSGGLAQVERFVVRLLSTESGHYPVYSWHEGTLVAAIRPADANGPAPLYGAE
jgi:hypothetical protein